MYPAFIQLETSLRMAEARLEAREMRRKAKSLDRAGSTGKRALHEPGATNDLALTIRLATTDDRTAIRRLAELDGRKAPTGEMLLALVDGELRVALTLENGATIADPFFPAAELVDLLRVRETTLHAPTDQRGKPIRARLALAWR
jgi:hypothetical protein